MERKQLLGSVIDEIEHHFKLFTIEKKAYLALAIVAGLCLVGAVTLLALKVGNPTLVIVALGASGLVAIAAARSTAFFHSSTSLVEDVVKRYSKLSDPELVSSVETLKKKSELSLMLVAAGAVVVLGSAGVAFGRIAAVQAELAQARDETARANNAATGWKQSFDVAQRDYATLRKSVEGTYAAHVTLDQQVIELRVASRPLPAKPVPKAKGALMAVPEPMLYEFTLRLSSSPETLGSIRRVRYERALGPDHPEADPASGNLVHVAENRAEGFLVTYQAPNCAPIMKVSLERESGDTETFDVDQCARLAAAAAAAAAAQPAAAKK